ncbi:MAG: DUF389 domain-containing protein [Flavobacteriaceae bacterium]|nr:DUF389 domain-containing protein [Flavobacteriaceae bacterium]
MSLETPQPNSQGEEQQKEEIKKDFVGLIGSIRNFVTDLINIRHNTDVKTTIAHIQEDIPFKGHTTWILVCSIFIASVGLNANSTAVVIGAMLISPLMGPILGMGMSLAINDIDTLRRSVKNFVVMVVISVLTAFLFFKFFPLRVESSELLARTEPDFRDVLIAFFGGLALVIARAKKGTMASVIYGVAIATALMPPLCTVGFGLAIWNLDYAGSAMFLFLINTILIGFATFLVLKLLRFPMVRYANSKRRRRIAQLASLLAIAVLVPAVLIFIKVYKKSQFMSEADDFVSNTIGIYQFNEGGRYLKELTDYGYLSVNDSISSIEVFVMGDERIPESVIDTWNVQKGQYEFLSNTVLRVVQSDKDGAEQQLKYISELYETKKEQLKTKDSEITMLKQELNKLSELKAMEIPFSQITSEAKINYKSIQDISFAYMFKTDFARLDTIPVFYVNWKDGMHADTIEKSHKQLRKWLKVRLGMPKLRVEK